ncbi:hypothetical protein ACFS07_30270 [Undibacterium arcticum]
MPGTVAVYVGVRCRLGQAVSQWIDAAEVLEYRTGGTCMVVVVSFVTGVAMVERRAAA